MIFFLSLTRNIIYEICDIPNNTEVRETRLRKKGRKKTLLVECLPVDCEVLVLDVLLVFLPSLQYRRVESFADF